MNGNTIILFATIAFIVSMLSACVVNPPSHPSRISLTGARNFRDLGGTPTNDGRRLKQGMLFRSDDLSNLTDDDIEKIADFNIQRIYDLRNDQERLENPDKLPSGNSIQLIGIPLKYDPLDSALMEKRVLSGDLDHGEVERIMIASYESYVIDYRKQIASIIKELAHPDAVPALVHCIHGKDRTGLVIFLILKTLDVPDNLIRDDYLLSNLFWASETTRLSRLAYLGSLFRTPPEEVRSLMEARPEYYDAALEAIIENYGSIENYLQEGLQLDSSTVSKLRDNLLE